MTTEREILKEHVRRKNEEGEVVTYSTVVRDKVLNRSNPTIFKLIEEMIGDDLTTEFIKSDTGHIHQALFIKTDKETHRDHLTKMWINETVLLRIKLVDFMNGRVSRSRKSYKWQSIEDYLKENEGLDNNKENIKEEGKV